MLRKTFAKTLLCSIVLSIGLTFAPQASAGGFYVDVLRPEKGDTEVKGAVLLVRAYGCHKPEDANLTATAEGIVNGKRQSIPLQLTKTSKGVFAIKQQWATSGAWVLNISGVYLGATRSLLVELGAQGKVQTGNDSKVIARRADHKFSAAEVDSALQDVSGKIARS
jgi:hypothetical protein